MSVQTSFPHSFTQSSTFINLPDGVKLAATMWIPNASKDGQDRYPSVLEYIPYRKSEGTAVRDSKRHPYLAGNGIASAGAASGSAGAAGWICPAISASNGAGSIFSRRA